MILTKSQFANLYPNLVIFRGMPEGKAQKKSSFRKTKAGWQCGNSFISPSRKCWRDPATGRKLDKPQSYREYRKQRASAYKKKQAGQELSKGEERLVSSIEQKRSKLLKNKEAIRLKGAARSVGASQVLSTGIAEVDPDKIAVDPKRFQYKIEGARSKSGEVGSLKGVKKWDANLAGIIQIWQDPKDKKVYVVNGHNRLALAKDLEVPKITARFLKAKSPEEARAIGALTNIAEGRGNAQDAAKFFRDTGLSKEDLDKKGVPLREKIATDGISLSRLSDGLFDEVVQGRLPESRAVVIGSKLENKAQQEALVKLIAKEEKRGKRITNEVISELADMTSTAPTKQEEEPNLLTLLGFDPEERSLAIEKAQVQASIKRQLSRDKKLFGTVGKSKAAKDLTKAGNKIDVEKSAAISQEAETTLRLFDKVKGYKGGVDDALNKAAERIANGENEEKVKREAYAEVTAELQKTFKYGKGKSSRSDRARDKRREYSRNKRLVEFNQNYYTQTRNGKKVRVRRNKTVYGGWWNNRTTATVVSAKSNSQARSKIKAKYKKGYGKLAKVALLNDRDAAIARRGDWVRTRIDGKSPQQSNRKSKYRSWL